MTGSEGNKLIMQQIQALLSNLSNKEYHQSLKVFHGGSIGEHIRHILEFYICLVDGTPQGQIDYGSRSRNNTLSQDIHAAADTLEYLRSVIILMKEDQLLDIKNEYNTHSIDFVYSKSSVGRELQYAFDHAIHHLALIRVAIETEMSYIQLDPQLGIAPSTLSFREKESNKLKTMTT